MYVFERNLSIFTASAYLISQQGPSSRSRICYHNDVIKWKHFPYYWRFVRGILWSTVELWCFLWHAPEQTVEQTIGTPVIWDTIALIITSLRWAAHYLGAVMYHIANVLYFYFLVGAKSCQKWYSLFNKTASFDCKHPQREIIDVIEKYMFWILWDKCTLLFSTPASIMALKYKANEYLSKLPMHICVNWIFFKINSPNLCLYLIDEVLRIIWTVISHCLFYMIFMPSVSCVLWTIVESTYVHGPFVVDQSHKSHNAPVPYPTMHHFLTEMCTCVHISVTKWCIVGYLSDALWDLWDGSIIINFGEHNVNFVTMTILICPGQKPNEPVAHVTSNGPDYGMKILPLSIPICINNVSKQR